MLHLIPNPGYFGGCSHLPVAVLSSRWLCASSDVEFVLLSPVSLQGVLTEWTTASRLTTLAVTLGYPSLSWRAGRLFGLAPLQCGLALTDPNSEL
jgi:hypothetical protein